jgi:hypothetical protein
MTDDFLNPNPVFPCICGHSITAHGTYEDEQRGWAWDDDHREEVEVSSSIERPVCYECGPADCIFVEMTNLEYLEFKSGADKR